MEPFCSSWGLPSVTLGQVVLQRLCSLLSFASCRHESAPSSPHSAAWLLPPRLLDLLSPSPASTTAGHLLGPSWASLPAPGQRAPGLVPVGQHCDPALPAHPRSKARGGEEKGVATTPTTLLLVPELGLGEEHLILVRPSHAADECSSTCFLQPP